MVNYIFDGTFDGLMTVIYVSYYNRQIPNDILSENSYQKNFLGDDIYISTDINKSDKVQNAITTKISKEALKNIYYVYLSELESSYMLIYKYVRLGFKIGRKINYFLQNDIVNDVIKLSQRINHEAYKMIELIRFKEIKKGLFYAKIHPDYNVLPLIVPHFAERFQDQYFVIHDVKRNLSAVYDKKSWIITDIPPEITLITKEEEDFENLWKIYYKSISIEERKNLRLQRQHMPKKYWDMLTEKQ
ncbi:TIGR03915 family putative DNA repair protein [Thermoanaerobacterium butyriciformans]|uniref:DNA metabolism protein n=1 Tax=Thermoanaerobacterium butyriciformans TaxID=1702242 RepID=A0ABS4NFD3_9THEO|nr:TIGR03915 family putative DNA repair protein [Thermoanaerobacterium butyriciformans]MBP2071884.1 putative DNA metabolism protein [Thermoanaerobacterium butyriciformans]